ncbi:MAG: glycine--tRNA ligase subunit beta [Brevinema sp.]
MSHFLFEILLEEVPHGILLKTSQHIQTKLPELLSKYGLSVDHIQHFATPRRFAFLLQGLPQKGQDREIEQKGPSLKAAYDEQKNPTKALTGFLSSYGVSLEDLEEREIKGQTYIFIKKTEIGLPIQEILPALLKELVDSFQFPQPMRWNHNNEVFEFIRPVRGITALLDEQILPVSFFGIQADRILKGHRQLFSAPVALKTASEYQKTMDSIACVADFDQRKQSIQDQSNAIISKLGAKALLDEDLLNTLASLTEFPHLVLADFDQAFLSLPKEVLISEMKVHQKYIPIIDQQGKLLPHYIITANISIDDEITRKNILAGNDRVLTARFTDGRFFFDEDTQKGLNFYADSLKSISFVDGAGSLADKIARMQKIADYFKNKLSPNLSSDHLAQAISLCKADLASLMVGEFPELQGIIGSYYADAMNAHTDVCLAIKEHYYPMVFEDEHLTPTQELSAIVGLADRVDNLFTLYAVGKTVTGSKDPYALRRQTIALIHLIQQFAWKNFSVNEMLSDLAPLYQDMLTIDAKEWAKLLKEFIKVRFEGVLKSADMQTDTINAVLATNIDFLLEDIQKVEALQKIRLQEKERFGVLVELAKRINNITKDAAISELKEELLLENAEKTLHQELLQTISKCENASHDEALLELVKLEGPITSFFDQIMVKTGDEKEQIRISLLSKISDLLKKYADFSKLS